jgi:hypothetical protein
MSKKELFNKIYVFSLIFDVGQLREKGKIYIYSTFYPTPVPVPASISDFLQIFYKFFSLISRVKRRSKSKKIKKYI